MTTDTGTGRGDDPAITVLSERARTVRVAENRAAAERLRACYSLYRECVRAEESGAGAEDRPGYAVVDPFDVCAGHLVALYAVSTGRAERMIDLAVNLTERFPAVLDALGEGRLDLQAAELLARQMRTVDPSVLDRVQREAVRDYLAAIESGERPGAGAVRDAIDDIIRRHDADGVRRRREDASRDRGVSLRKEPDGMCTLRATLMADEAAVLSARLDAVVAGMTESSGELEQWSPAEQRADALMALVCGEVPGSDGAAVLRPQITVIARPDSAEPTVRFPRTGEAAMQALLAMLATSDGASLTRIDPTIGASDDPASSRTYRPSAALERAIKLRDGTCRHPGCTISAEYCDVDHAIPFDPADPARGGPTMEWNHLIFCRRHHRFKTFSDWRYHLSPDGTLVVETPDGKRMITRPSGPLAEYRRADAAAQAAAEAATREAMATGAPASPVPATPDDSPVPTYFHRRAQRIRAERAAASRAPRAGRGTSWLAPEAERDAEGNPVSRIERELVALLEEPPF